jgi:hypothetical protein
MRNLVGHSHDGPIKYHASLASVAQRATINAGFRWHLPRRHACKAYTVEAQILEISARPQLLCFSTGPVLGIKISFD